MASDAFRLIDAQLRQLQQPNETTGDAGAAARLVRIVEPAEIPATREQRPGPYAVPLCADGRYGRRGVVLDKDGAPVATLTDWRLFERGVDPLVLVGCGNWFSGGRKTDNLYVTLDLIEHGETVVSGVYRATLEFKRRDRGSAPNPVGMLTARLLRMDRAQPYQRLDVP